MAALAGAWHAWGGVATAWRAVQTPGLLGVLAWEHSPVVCGRACRCAGGAAHKGTQCSTVGVCGPEAAGPQRAGGPGVAALSASSEQVTEEQLPRVLAWGWTVGWTPLTGEGSH